MFWLIENTTQFEEFKKKNIDKAFVEVIPYSPNIHPSLNYVSCIYIKPIEDYKGYVIPLNHSEVENNFEYDEVFDLLNSLEIIYCRDKKEFLHYFPIKQTIDITFNINHELTYTKAHEFFYEKHPDKFDINIIIPITKHYEYCENLYEELEYLIDQPVNEFYNHKASWVFYYIEKNGISVDLDLFNKSFNKDYNNNKIHTRYNLKTLTRRPSNAFDGVNYAALDKENGCRKSFIPENDLLVEIDISAYHPTLISQLIKYNNVDNIYETISKEFKIPIQKAKEITFQQIYGGIQDKYKTLEFFKSTDKLIQKIWSSYQKTITLKCPISQYEISGKDTVITPQKLFNYLLQNLETSNNILIMWDIIKLLKNKKTKLILYTYDSFLFDFDKNEKDILVELDNIFSKRNLEIKVKYGKNYDFK